MMRWPGIMRQGWSWLLEGAEEWGIDWANSVELYMRYAVIYNFPVRDLTLCLITTACLLLYLSKTGLMHSCPW